MLSSCRRKRDLSMLCRGFDCGTRRGYRDLKRPRTLHGQDVSRLIGEDEVLPDDPEAPDARVVTSFAGVDSDEREAVADEPAVRRPENRRRDRNRSLRRENAGRNPVAAARQPSGACVVEAQG